MEARDDEPAGGERWRRLQHWLHRQEVVLFALLALSAGGIGVTDFAPRFGFRYWMAMVPVFAAVSLAAGGVRARHGHKGVARALAGGLVHWLGVFFAMFLVFLLYRSGRMNNEAAGLVALLVLALGTFLDGVRTQWELCLAGAVLALSVAVTALAEQYLWGAFLPLSLLAFVGLIGWRRLSGR